MHGLTLALFLCMQPIPAVTPAHDVFAILADDADCSDDDFATDEDIYEL